jgi:flagellar hook-length control protein FliK
MASSARGLPGASTKPPSIPNARAESTVPPSLPAEPEVPPAPDEPPVPMMPPLPPVATSYAADASGLVVPPAPVAPPVPAVKAGLSAGAASVVGAGLLLLLHPDANRPTRMARLPARQRPVLSFSSVRTPASAPRERPARVPSSRVDQPAVTAAQVSHAPPPNSVAPRPDCAARWALAPAVSDPLALYPFRPCHRLGG